MALKREGAGGRCSSGSRHRQPQPIDRTEDRQKQSPGNSHLGQLEDHSAGVTDDLCPDLDQLLPSGRQGPALDLPRQDQLPEEVPKVVGQDEEMGRTLLSSKSWHDRRVHRTAFLPSLIHCSAVPLWL